jgi:hypothetical protein
MIDAASPQESPGFFRTLGQFFALVFTLGAWASAWAEGYIWRSLAENCPAASPACTGRYLPRALGAGGTIFLCTALAIVLLVASRPEHEFGLRKLVWTMVFVLMLAGFLLPPEWVTQFLPLLAKYLGS